MAWKLLVLALLGTALLTACGEAEPTVNPQRPPAAPATTAAPAGEPVPPSEPANAVLYTIGLSTDPYGESRPAGIGLVTGLETGDLRRDEIRDDDLGWFWPPPRWIDPARVVASRKGPPFRPPLVFAVADDLLRRLGPAPLRPLEPVGHWSPDGTLVATEPIAPASPSRASMRATGNRAWWRSSPRTAAARGSVRGISAGGHPTGGYSSPTIVARNGSRSTSPPTVQSR
jgi:hypothetical protein